MNQFHQIYNEWKLSQGVERLMRKSKLADFEMHTLAWALFCFPHILYLPWASFETSSFRKTVGTAVLYTISAHD